VTPTHTTLDGKHRHQSKSRKSIYRLVRYNLNFASLLSKAHLCGHIRVLSRKYNYVTFSVMMHQGGEVLIHTKFCSRKIMYVYTSELLQTRHGSKLEYVNLSPVHYLKWLNSFNKTDGRGIKTERRIVWSRLYFTNIKRPHLELVIRLKDKGWNWIW